MKKRKLPNDVARFFNPQKSGTNAEYNKFGFLVKPGTNQAKRWRKEVIFQCTMLEGRQEK